MFDSLSDRLGEVFKRFSGKGKLSKEDVEAGLREVRMALLEADVNFKVARAFVERIRERAVQTDVLESLTPGQTIVSIVNEELTALLGGEQRRIRYESKPPTVVMLLGLQGSGKTTKKKPSYLEAREYESIEQRVHEAEHVLKQKRAVLEDPSLARDGRLIEQAYREVEEAQAAVDAIYARWAELEQKMA